MGKAESERITQLVKPIKDDLLSGAAELALQAVTIFHTIIKEEAGAGAAELQELITEAAGALVRAQPAMAPIFHLCNSVLIAIEDAKSREEIISRCQSTIDAVEKQLCDSVARIADETFDLIEYGSLVFAYSFSSTVVSTLLHARSKGKYFRVACTEARPSMEGRKLAKHLASGGIEVIHTFDNAMGLVLPNCSAAFMGCDCIARPGVVNKVGSWVLAVACRELKVPLYALSGSDKFVSDDRLFEFEKQERPGEDVWEDAPRGVRILNHQFDLVPFELFTGLVTENGVLEEEKDIESHLPDYKVHESLKLAPALTVSD